MVRYGLVFLTWGVVTWNYYMFHHFVHKPRHFVFPNNNGGGGGDGHNQTDRPNTMDSYNTTDSQNTTDSHINTDTGEGNHNHTNNDHQHSQHGRGGPFDRIHDKVDSLFLYGLVLPLTLLTLASLIWNPTSTSTDGANGTMNATIMNGSATTTKKVGSRPGEMNVHKWTIIWFVLPLLLVMLDGARGHFSPQHGSTSTTMQWNLYIRICMSLMSPSGYGATWALSLFLIPVTKHSPILDWLHVTPIQALAFHRIAGWTSFWYSVLHGFLHLRHLMDVLNPQHMRPWYQQLKILLIPNTFQCIATQNPFQVFHGNQISHLEEDGQDGGRQCWLALVNATGMISVLAFVLLAITSLPRVRRYSYALFYIVHIPMAWLMLFTAIWHYPTCALILIPNIIYYLSFNIPVYMTQAMDKWRLESKLKRDGTLLDCPLVEANWIQGGSIELTFAVTDSPRHESRFVRLSHPSISSLSHPFSVFSHQHLTINAIDAQDDDHHSSSKTLSILFRPTGPFTQGLKKVLFPNYTQDTDETDPQQASNDSESFMVPLSSMSRHHMLQFDSFYAGTFDWIDNAMVSHDEILLVAGGVGIAPFLEFLPTLQQRIESDTASAAAAVDNPVLLSATATDGRYNAVARNETTLLDSHNAAAAQIGPNRIHLHWYCREVGLASYVWYNHLRHHVENAWENSPACKGRLMIHLHLTSLSATIATTTSSSSPATEGGEELLKATPNTGLVMKRTYNNTTGQQQQDSIIHPVQDVRFIQTWWIGLMLPGTLMVAGTIIHWLWYKQVIMSEQFRNDNLVLRSHSIVFTLGLAMVVTVFVEHYLRTPRRRPDNTMMVQQSTHTGAATTTTLASTTATVEQNKPTTPPEIDDDVIIIDDNLVVISKGRPKVDTVIDAILAAKRPGVYSCGPHALMESVQDSIRWKRKDCAFYREDSEM